jgi:uncharacterized membrane protein (UPF0182 family)
MSKIKKLIILAIVILVGSIIFLGSGVNLISNWLWFESLGFLSTFLTKLTGEIGFRLGAWLLAAVIFSGKPLVYQKISPRLYSPTRSESGRSRRGIPAEFNSTKFAKIGAKINYCRQNYRHLSSN